MKFGDNLKNIRKNKKMSQESIAEKAERMDWRGDWAGGVVI